MEKDDTCENILDLMSGIFAENLDVDGLQASEPVDETEHGEK